MASPAKFLGDPAHAEVFQGIEHVGGLLSLYRDRRFSPLPKDYFTDAENLAVEIGIVMKLRRTKLLPTYTQMEDDREELCNALLFHGGYPATAEKLGIPAAANYLAEPRNLRWELQTIEIARARLEEDRILDNGLPDCWLDHMPTESELRSAKRADLHKAIEGKHGGYFHAAEAMQFWLPARFWEGNPSLRKEMKAATRLLKKRGIMPSKADLDEIGRHDLAKAIDRNGGYRRTAEFCKLQTAKPSKGSERPLGDARERFVPYPFRRFDPKLQRKVDGRTLGFEVPSDVKKGAPPEYGVWIIEGNAAASGRGGRIRCRANHPELWLYRLEGESSWRGMFDEADMMEILRSLLKGCGLTPS